MKHYISEERAIYEDLYHGQFSKKLAQWAIDCMETKDEATKTIKPIIVRRFDDVQEVLRENGVKIPNECIYTGWYLFNMAVADYPKTCKNDELRASFVDETINDIDGEKENVLDCFVTKMRNKGVPIYWELYL